jgi:hypothetical protein
MRSKTSNLFKAVIELETDYDVIVLLETNFTDEFKDEELFDGRYFVFRSDRTAENSVKNSGGGVLTAVK